jgi:hypothetical protein
MRWWLASLLANWAHSLTRRDGGDAWFEEFAFAYLRAHRPDPRGDTFERRSDHFCSPRPTVRQGSLSGSRVTTSAARLSGE